jgi:hypothetical protein
MSLPADDATLTDAELQRTLAKTVELYAARVEREGPLLAFPADAQVTATDVMVTVSAMLKAVNLQLFELGMWQAWSGR